MNKISSVISFFCLTWLPCSHILSVVPGTLDTTFNPGGVQPGTVSTTIDNATTPALSRAVAIQSDGKIVIAGVLNGNGIAFISKFALARFNTNGTLDTTFNASGPQPGTLSTTIDNIGDAEGYDIAIQSDGKIVVSGMVNLSNSATTKCAVARFNTNGSLDTTFNPSGVQPGTVSTTINNQHVLNNNIVCTVVLQADGKIVITGNLNAFALARFNTNGTLDTTFNPTGVQPGTLTTTIDTTNAGTAFDVAIQLDGKIVVSGTIYNGNPALGALARFNSDGSLDISFNAGGAKPGTLTTTIANLNAQIYPLALQANGKIVIAGESDPAGNFAALARFNTNGTLDTTFNSGGVQPGTLTLSTMNSLPNAFAYWVALQSSTQIIMGGGVYTAALMGIARFNPNGALDTTFNPSGAQPGTVTTTIDNISGEQVFMVAIQPDNKIVVTGEAAGLNKFVAARFNGNNTTIINVCSS